jgi:hypothetical protein
MKEQPRSRTMGRSLIGLYALAVCFCTLMCLMVVLGIGAYSLVRIAAPEFTLASHTWAQSDEQYLQWYPDQKKLTPSQLIEAREETRKAAIQYERRSALQMFVYVLIIGVIDGVVYAIHWRLAKRTDMHAVPAT